MIPVASLAGIRSGTRSSPRPHARTILSSLAAYDYLRPEFDIALADITQPDLCSDDYPHHKMRVTRVVALTPKTSVNLAV